MNIFAFDENPAVCAASLDDVRLRKMTIETAQIISTAFCLLGKGRGLFRKQLPGDATDVEVRFNKTLLMRPTHMNHPVVKWAAAEHNNLCWTIALHKWLGLEGERRFDVRHVCANFALLQLIDEVAGYPDGVYPPLTLYRGFANCAANSKYDLGYKSVVDTCAAYRMYINDRWVIDTDEGRPPRFTMTMPPYFADPAIPFLFRHTIHHPWRTISAKR